MLFELRQGASIGRFCRSVSLTVCRLDGRLDGRSVGWSVEKSVENFQLELIGHPRLFKSVHSCNIIYWIVGIVDVFVHPTSIHIDVVYFLCIANNNHLYFILGIVEGKWSNLYNLTILGNSV